MDFNQPMDSVATGADSDGPTEIIQVGKFPPTSEQAAIITTGLDTQQNMLIDALAGAAKTSTLVMLANQPKMQRVSTLCLAFNKKIADEMREVMPSNVMSATLHSLGNRVWAQAIGRRSKVSGRKGFEIMKELVAKQRKDVQETLFDCMADMMKTVSWGKACGWVPDACKRSNSSLMTDEQFFMHLPEQVSPIEEQLITAALLLSIEAAYEGEIDFDDMVYMPTIFPSRFPSYPLTMVDEAQDLSALNHYMLTQIVRDNRLIAVGDPCQAIYGFRGAHQDSMNLLEQRFDMHRLQLTTSFRCPKAIVREAQWRAPAMKAPDWAEEGEVKRFTDWSVDDLPQDAVIICRNNAPLFKCAIRLLIDGRFPQIVGNDIGKALTKALKKFGPATMPADEVRAAIDTLERTKLSKARDHAKGSVRDFCECLRTFVPRGDTLGDIMSYAEHIMTATGPIRLMTIHKSKGLEFKNVFILDRHLCRIDKEPQDRNVLYVGQTRAQAVLSYVETDEFVLQNFEQEEEG